MPSCGGTCCPYGCSFVAPCILSIFAMIATWSASWSCHYLYIETKGLGGIATGHYFMGPYTVEQFVFVAGLPVTAIVDNGGDCVLWEDHEEFDSDDRDSPIRTARVFTAFATYAGFCFWVILLFGGCCVIKPQLLKLVAGMFFFVAVMMILSLVMLASKYCDDANDCHLDGSGAMSPVAFVLWILTGLTVFCLKNTEENITDLTGGAPAGMEMTGQPNTETVEETIVEEDGSVYKVTTTTVTNPDGSKQVTETRELVQNADGSPAATDVPLADGKVLPT